MSADALPIGTRVMVASPQWGVLIGVVVASDVTAPGLGPGAYDVRTDSGAGYFCLPEALFDLRLAGACPPICIAREGGRA